MSKLAEFRAAEKELQEQLAALEALKLDTGLQREMEFEKKLRELMQEYGVNLGKIISILDPSAGIRQSNKQVEGAGKLRKPRVVKVYKNPHNGETIQTKGGNHKVLKDWKSKWGADVVESWKTDEA